MNEIDKQADTAIKDLQCNELSKQGVFTVSGTAACSFGDLPDHNISSDIAVVNAALMTNCCTNIDMA